MNEFMGLNFNSKLGEAKENFIREKKQCPFCVTGGVHEGRKKHVPLIDLQVETLESYQCQICRNVYILDWTLRERSGRMKTHWSIPCQQILCRDHAPEVFKSSNQISDIDCLLCLNNLLKVIKHQIKLVQLKKGRTP